MKIGVRIAFKSILIANKTKLSSPGRSALKNTLPKPGPQRTSSVYHDFFVSRSFVGMHAPIFSCPLLRRPMGMGVVFLAVVSDGKEHKLLSVALATCFWLLDHFGIQ